MKYNKIKYKYLKLLLVAFLVSFSILPAFSQTESEPLVTGIVVDTKGQPVNNVAVVVVDNFEQYYTNAKGAFSLSALEGYTLRFSKENYQSQDVKLQSDSATLKIVLKSIENETIYNVGYTSRNKYNLTSAISTISSAELTQSPTTSIESAMTGKASGLTIMRSSGNEPGYQSSSIYIRGIGTFGEFRAPLILVDDFERNISQLDIHEIESVSILKDGAANAQYGQRGANGTLLVSTKRGIVGKPEIEFISQFGMQRTTNIPKFLGSREYLTLYRKALINDGISLPTDSKYNPDMYDDTQDAYLYPNVNWYNSILKKSAPQQEYKLTFRGGTEIVKYFILFGYLNQDGIYKHTNENQGFNTNLDYSRYNIRSNFDVNITKDLSVTLDIAGQIENHNMPNSATTDIFGTLSGIVPYAMPIQYADGRLAGTSVYQNNPLGMISRTGYRSDRNKGLQIKAEGIHKLDFLLSGLSANLSVAYDGLSGYGKGKSASYAVYEHLGGDSYSTYGENKDVSLQFVKFYDSYQYMLAFNGGLSFAKDFAQNSIIADIRYYQSQTYTMGDNPAFARQGVNGKATYSYDKKYVAEFSFAYDGSEEFAQGKRFGFFPAISGAWILSNESFLKDYDNLNFLKLRASYGQTGNRNHGFGRYAYQSHWSGFDSSSGGYIFGSGHTWSDGAWEGRPANPNLTWETSYNLNIGFDAEMFSKLTVSFDAFRHDRKDIITEMSGSSSSVAGAPLPYVNYGSVLNQGFELSAIYKSKAGKVNYFVQGNVSLAKNKITKIDEIAGLADYLKKNGKSVTQMWGLEALGFYADENDILNSPISTFYTVKPGDIKYKNQNPDEDNSINSFDEIPIGNPTVPEWTFGLTLGCDYRGFDFSALLSGVANRSVYLNNVTVWGLQNNNNATSILYGAWEQGVNETGASYPRLTTENNLNNYRSSSFWIKNGNFLRISNLELGYQLPASILQKIKIKQVRLHVNAQNLFSFHHLKDYNLDPEVVDAGISGYPNMRVFNVGLNIKF